jgi:MFS family permease
VPSRLVSKPFIAVTAAALAFFTYVGMLVPIVPTFVDDQLNAGELGVGLSLAAFAAAAICARPAIGRLVERFGRRPVMIGGALLAGFAGFLCSTAHSLWFLLGLRGVAGIGEAALFVGAATLVADLAPPHRRAEAASYFSVAVFGGLGIGPILGDAVLGDDNYGRAFLLAGAVAWFAAALCLLVPRRVEVRHDDARHDDELPVRRGFERIMHPAAVGPGLVLACGIAGFAVFTAFIPEYSKDIGFAGSGGLFAVYSAVCLLLRFVGARWLERLGVRNAALIAFGSLSVALTGLALFPDAWALWLAAGLVGFASAFLYPSLMALTVNRADERERPLAISSFTMFFEVGNITGGVVFGLIAQLATQRTAFGAGVVLCVLGTWLLESRGPDRPACRCARHGCGRGRRGLRGLWASECGRSRNPPVDTRMTSNTRMDRRSACVSDSRSARGGDGARLGSCSTPITATGCCRRATGASTAGS